MTSAGSRLFRVAVLLAVALAMALAAGMGVQHYNRELAIGNGFERLKLFHDLRKATLEDYLSSKASDVKAMSRNRRVTVALRDLAASWSEIEPAPADLLRRLYIAENPYSPAERDLFDRSPGTWSYHEAHQEFHGWARRFLGHFGYHDLFLIDPQGNIVYTVRKQDDFATNLADGPYGDSPLGQVFAASMKRSGRRVVFSDFELYEPSNDAAAAFAGNAIVDDAGAILGVFVVQLPPDPINTILSVNGAMGETGETYIVGNDLLMRSQSRFLSERTLLVTEVDTSSARDGLNGFSGARVITNYRDRPVLSVFSPVTFDGAPWVLLAEIERAEIVGGVAVWQAVAAALLAALIAAGAVHLGFRFLGRDRDAEQDQA